MRNAPIILSAALALQLAVAGGLAWQSHQASGVKPGPLVRLDPAAVDRVVIDQPGQPALTLSRNTQPPSAKAAGGPGGPAPAGTAGAWRLPSGYPVAPGRVEDLLKSVAGLKRGWPVATTAAAEKRFKVAEDDFEHRLTLAGGGKTLVKLLVGTSPSFRQNHVRVAGGKDIYALPFDASQVGTKAGDWADHAPLTLSEQDMTRIDMPGAALVRGEDSPAAAQPAKGADAEKSAQATPKPWRLTDLKPGEQMDQGAVGRLVAALASPPFADVRSPDAAKDYDFANPAFQGTVSMAGGRQVTYTLGKARTADAGKTAADYGLRISGQPYLFVVPRFDALAFLQSGRDKLIAKPPAPAAAGNDKGAPGRTSAAATNEGKVQTAKGPDKPN